MICNCNKRYNLVKFCRKQGEFLMNVYLDRINHFLEEHNLTVEKRILVITYISEVLFYFLYLRQVSAYNYSPTMQLITATLMIIIFIDTYLNPATAAKLLALLIFFPFIFFPIVTLTLSLFTLIAILITISANLEYSHVSHYSIILIIALFLCMQITHPTLYIIPFLILLMLFSQRIGMFNIMLYFTFFILFLLSHTVHMSLIDTLNNAPFLKNNNLIGFEALGIYYSHSALTTTPDPLSLLIPISNNSIDLLHSLALLFVLLFTTCGHFLSYMSFKLFNDDNRKRLQNNLVAIGLSLIIFVILYIIHLKLFNNTLSINIPLLILITLFTTTILTFITVKPEKKSTSSIAINANAQQLIYFNNLTKIGANYLTILTELTDEVVKQIAILIYGKERWFDEIKNILIKHPDIYRDSSSIVDYRDMDITMATRLLTDRESPLNNYIYSHKEYRPILSCIRSIRNARNSFAHNNTKNRLEKMHVYLLADACNKLKDMIYTLFPQAINVTSYNERIGNLKKAIDKV